MKGIFGSRPLNSLVRKIPIRIATLRDVWDVSSWRKRKCSVLLEPQQKEAGGVFRADFQAQIYPKLIYLLLSCFSFERPLAKIMTFTNGFLGRSRRWSIKRGRGEGSGSPMTFSPSDISSGIRP